MGNIFEKNVDENQIDNSSNSINQELYYYKVDIKFKPKEIDGSVKVDSISWDTRQYFTHHEKLTPELKKSIGMNYYLIVMARNIMESYADTCQYGLVATRPKIKKISEGEYMDYKDLPWLIGEITMDNN